MLRRTLSLAAAALIAAGAAHAADPAPRLAQTSGEVLVASGGKISAAKAGVALKPGDRVVVRSGVAALEFPDGCKAKVPANGMLTVGQASPCAGSPGLVQAGGSAAQLGIPDWPVGAYFAGAGVVVIAGAILYGLSDPLSD